ncbi:linker histone H1M [Polymixia lowei]
MVMVKEALKELDTRKGVSSQAIRTCIKQKYPTVDLVRLKNMVRKALIKGIESGVFVRPANSTFTTGAQGRFRLPPKKGKEPKPKTENTDPNLEKVPKATKTGGAKKPKEADDGTGTTKKKDTVGQQEKSKEPAKKVKTDKGAASSKVAPAKKPKASAIRGEEGASGQTKPKAKASKVAKGEKVSQVKAAKPKADADKVGDKKTAGKRGKKTSD